MKMTVTFDRNDGTKPERLLAEAAINFEAESGPLDGLKLVGFSVWRSADGEDIYVTLPARAFGSGKDRRYFDYIRSISGEHKETDRLKSFINDAWREAQKGA